MNLVFTAIASMFCAIIHLIMIWIGLYLIDTHLGFKTSLLIFLVLWISSFMLLSLITGIGQLNQDH